MLRGGVLFLASNIILCVSLSRASKMLCVSCSCVERQRWPLWSLALSSVEDDLLCLVRVCLTLSNVEKGLFRHSLSHCVPPLTLSSVKDGLLCLVPRMPPCVAAVVADDGTLSLSVYTHTHTHKHTHTHTHHLLRDR